MLEALFEIHSEVMGHIPRNKKRFIFNKINWNSQAICLVGARGVGKTTVLCQHLLQRYATADKALYISADNIHVLSTGLFEIARQYFALGGEALYIDEVHKYPNWSIELKNIIDTYAKHQIIFSGSSAIELMRSKADLSRRVVYHSLPGLSFREYLNLELEQEFEAVPLEYLLEQHTAIATELKKYTVLKHFKHYLQYGYYPYYLQSKDDYFAKVNNVIEKILYEDITVLNNIKVVNVPILKKLLWVIATSEGLTPNFDKISKDLKVSRDMIYNCFDYLQQSGLTLDLFAQGKSLKLVRRPGKVYMNNPNLLMALNLKLRTIESLGVLRETFFVNQLSYAHKLRLHEKADFIIDDNLIVEVGGRSKTQKQIDGLENAYLAIDDVEIAIKNRIPLYLFGFLY